MKGKQMEFTINVNRALLIDKITDNREKHRAIFEKALEGYRAAAIKAFQERIDLLKAGKRVDLYVRLEEPKDHTDDYDRILRMLNMHLEASIELGEEEFASYVDDDWVWKRQWITTNSAYTDVN